jgi:hypothetical protein
METRPTVRLTIQAQADTPQVAVAQALAKLRRELEQAGQRSCGISQSVTPIATETKTLYEALVVAVAE